MRQGILHPGVRVVSAACAALVTGGAALCQPAAPAEAFEVASVKVAQIVAGPGEGKGPRGLKTSPGTVTVRNMPLSAIVQWAYGLKRYQVSAPRWAETQGYDIFAKAAGPAKDPELQAMMRALLADRFKLATHREIKELPVYEMTIAKGGHKLKVSAGEGEGKLGPGKESKMALQADRATMAQFADVVSGPLQRPVVDKTGLEGGFDFTLDLMTFMPMDANGNPSPEKVPVEDRETIIVMAIQEQLGLKLEPKKDPIEMLVIDRAEKVPTEN